MGTRGGYDTCTGNMCASQCASNVGGCASLCTSSTDALFQKFTIQYPNPRAAALVQAADEPVKLDPAAERAVAIAHSVADRSSRCFLSNMGTRGGYDTCTGNMCASQCGSNVGGCSALCTSQTSALYQKLAKQHR